MRGTRRECWQTKKLLVHICHFRNQGHLESEMEKDDASVVFLSPVT